MELHHLRYFVAVAKHRNITRAAAELRIAQPSLSQQIRRLEELLGAQLFDRSGGPVRLTDAGLVLLPRAEAILAQTEDARQAVKEVHGLRRGRLVIGTLPTTGSRVLPGVLAEFRSRYPGIQVVLREESTTVLTDVTIRGEADLSLTTLPTREDVLAVQELFSEEILLAVPPGHPLAGQGKVDLKTLKREPFILMKQGYGFRELAIHACRSAGFEPRVASESANMDTIISLVSVGLGISLVPHMMADRERAHGPVYLEVETPRLTRTLALVWRKDKYLSAAARAFLEVTQATLQHLPASAATAAENGGDLSPSQQ